MALELMKNYYYLWQWSPSSFPNYIEAICYMERSLNIGGCIDNLVHNLYLKLNEKYRGNDISKKLKILKKCSMQYQGLINNLIQYRNKIIHKNHTTIKLLQDISLDVIALYTADEEFCDQQFFHDWNEIYNLILEKCPSTLMCVSNNFTVKKFYNIFSEQWDNVYEKNLLL